MRLFHYDTNRFILLCFRFVYSAKDESIRGEKMDYGDEFLLRAENYGDPTVNFISFVKLS